jgi:lycopene elongase/hydratase (dihydrobisanhydrobacterioruberin-forming)
MMDETLVQVERGNYRTCSPSRRIGYRLLPGDGYSYLLHMRPREWPIVAGHVLFGFLLALPAEAGAASRWPQAIAGVATFVLLLNGGTLAINSAYDRDEGDVGYLDSPPPPPRHLFGFGLTLMLLGQVVSLLLLPTAFAAVYAGCFAMSLLYSVPPFRFKAVAGLDLLINALGFGTLTALAGWTLAAVAPPLWAWAVLLGFGPLFAGLYPLTQFYQMEEDRARGDRTLALVIGVRRSLLFALAMTAAAFALFLWGLARGPAGGFAALAVLPAALWCGILLRWLTRHPTMSAAEHKAGMYHALVAWAVTNVTLLAAVLLPSVF